MKKKGKAGFGGDWTYKIEKWKMLTERDASDREIEVLIFWPFYFFSYVFSIYVFSHLLLLDAIKVENLPSHLLLSNAIKVEKKNGKGWIWWRLDLQKIHKVTKIWYMYPVK